jgi:hypothetical protein
MSAPRDPAWTAQMARQVARRVRWSARLSWLAAVVTVVGTAAVVLTPDSADGPGLTEVVVSGPARALPRAHPSPGAATAEDLPVRVRLAEGGGAAAAPVDIRF